MIRYPASRFSAAFRAHRTDPVEVARRCLDAIQDSEHATPPLRAFISFSGPDVQRQVEASAQRYAAGEQLSLLDGVPVAIQDALDVTGYRTTGGTSFHGVHPTSRDSTVARKLRDLGMIVLGKTNTHELGLGVTGINPHHGAARNPHDPERICGGAAGGNGAALAAGLCPLGVATDTTGALRISSALCGVTGLKPTPGRISLHGVFPVAWSMDHVGVMASCVEDAATLYCRLAGADAADPSTLGLPSESPQLDLSRGVRGLRVGVDEEFIQAAEPDVAAGVRRAMEALVEQGAVRVEVTIPHKQHLRTAAWITLLAEAAAAQEKVLRDRIEMVGPDVRLLLLAGSRITAAEYLKAQRVRAMVQRDMATVFSSVDVLVLPTTACTAPRLHPDAITGEVDDALNEQLTRYTTLANLVGVPALSVPGPPAANGMPVGIQILGRAFEEEKVLRAGAAVEQWSLPLQGRPKVWFDVMP